MSNYENLINKILNDAENKKNSIINKAKEEADIIIDSRIKEAKQYNVKLIERANRDGNQLKDKIISKADLGVRKRELESKKKILDNIFDQALEELINLDRDDLKKYIVDTIDSLDSISNYNLLIPSTYNVDDFNEIVDNSQIINIQLSDVLKGGFILERNGTLINYSFEVLINFIREEIEFEVSNLLFN